MSLKGRLLAQRNNLDFGEIDQYYNEMNNEYANHQRRVSANYVAPPTYEVAVQQYQARHQAQHQPQHQEQHRGQQDKIDNEQQRDHDMMLKILLHKVNKWNHCMP